MSDDKTSGIQETFISHLIELRNRLVRASAVVLVVFIVLFTVCPVHRFSTTSWRSQCCTLYPKVRK